MYEEKNITESVFWPFTLALAIILPVSMIDYHGLVPLAATLGILAFVKELRKGIKLSIYAIQPVLIFLGLLIIGAFSLIWSYNTSVTFDRLSHLMAVFLIGCLVLGSAHLQISRSVNLRTSSIAYLIGIFPCLLFVLLEAINESPKFSISNFLDITLSLSNPTVTIMAVFTLPGCLLLWKGLGSRSAMIVFITSCIAIFSSNSLAANLGLIVGSLVTIIIILGGKKAFSFTSLSMIFIVLFFPVARLIHDSPFSFLRKFMENTDISVPPSALHRTYIYDFVLDKIIDNPLVGWGLGVSRHLPGSQNKILDLNRELIPLHPHNGVLEVWVELGIIGAIGLSFVIWMMMRGINNRIQDRISAAVLAGTSAGYMTIGLASYSIWSSWWMTTGILAAGLCTALFAHREVPETSSLSSKKINNVIVKN